MDRFSTLCRYVVVLLVSFEYVRCGGDDGWGLWKNLNDAEQFWKVTIQCQASGNLQKPPLVMKLKELKSLGESYDNAYIIYEVDDKGNSSFELVAVRSEGPSTGQKNAEFIVRFPLANALLDVDNKRNNKLKIRDIINSRNSCELTFEAYNEVQDVIHKYANRIPQGCSPRPAE